MLPSPPPGMSSAEIIEDMADRIRRGDYKPGDRLPKYVELMRLYGAAYGTIATVMAGLKKRNLVKGVRGKGVYVLGRVPPPIPPKKATDSPFAT